MIEFPQNPQGYGAAAGAFLLGLGGFAAWWASRRVTTARQDAEVDVVQLMREELARLAAGAAEQQEALAAMARRVRVLEQREGRLLRHIGVLEHLMRQSGLDPPLLETRHDDPHH